MVRRWQNFEIAFMHFFFNMLKLRKKIVNLQPETKTILSMLKATRLLAIALLTSIVCSSVASPVDLAKAEKVAKAFWRTNYETSKHECLLQATTIAADEGFGTFYVFRNASGLGYVIVSSDDCVKPILAYSATDIIESPLPLGQKNMLRWYDRQINGCVAKGVEPTPDIDAQWQRYVSGKAGMMKSATSVRPMLTTKWNQSPLYNNFCPYDIVNREHALAGCVAVAMAQTLKYWNHPATGVGTNAYQHQTYGTISAQFNNTTYDWTHMTDQLGSTSTYQELSAIATLMLHCGVSCNMNYGTDGSSAGVNGNRYGTSEYAFKNFFGYKNSLHSISRDDSLYTDSLWTETLRFELDNHRPVVYTGYDYTDTNDVVGHAFVCDGYDTNDYFHFNWGWGGSADGYYALSNLNPSHVFNDYQYAIIGMEPDSNLLGVTPTQHVIAGNGGSAQSTVIAMPNDSSSWTASTDQQWITLSRTSGPGLGAQTAITISASPNNQGYSRNGFVDIVQDSQIVTIYISQPDASHSEGGWYGNSQIDTEEPVLSTTQNLIIIRPESYGNFAQGDKITHVKFRTRKRVPGYNNSSFVIKVFRNPTFSATLDSGQCETSSVRGRPIYSENYTISNFDIDQIVPLSTPYVITNEPFWIGLQSSGGTLYKARRTCVNNIPDGSAPLIDSLNIHYLNGMTDGQTCPALVLNQNGSTWSQCEIEYYFQFFVELGKDGIEQPETTQAPTVKVYPNPTTGLVNFSQEVRHVEVYDNTGRRVLTADNVSSVNLHQMHKGLYTLRIVTENGTIVRKVVKQQ